MADKICGVYKITSPVGGIYVGHSRDIKARKKSYETRCHPGQRKLYNSIKKYGWESHSFQIIDTYPPDWLNNMEVYWIFKYRSFETDNGLNLTCGGFYEIPGEETRDLRRRLVSGSNNPMHGKKPTEESNEKRRKAHALIVETTRERSRRTSTGRVFSLESRKKKSKALMGHSVSDNARKKIGEANSKKVYQYSLSGDFIKEWSSVKEAHRALKAHNISNCCKGKGKSSGGFKWSYIKL